MTGMLVHSLKTINTIANRSTMQTGCDVVAIVQLMARVNFVSILRKIHRSLKKFLNREN